MLLVGNKCDLTDEQVVTQAQAEELARSLDVLYFEASAKDDVKVGPIFDCLMESLLLKAAENTNPFPEETPSQTKTQAQAQAQTETQAAQTEAQSQLTSEEAGLENKAKGRWKCC